MDERGRMRLRPLFSYDFFSFVSLKASERIRLLQRHKPIKAERKETAALQKPNGKNTYFWAATIALLMLLSFVSGVLASSFLLKTGDNTPQTDISVNLGNGTSETDGEDGKDSADKPSGSETDKETDGNDTDTGDTADTDAESGESTDTSDTDTDGTDTDSGTEDTDAHEATDSVEPPKNPGATVGDAVGIWSGETTVEIFKAEYDENGEITVKSAYGDKVIAPGTSNSYYFDIKNTGDTPIYYSVKTEAILSFKVNGETMSVPVEARFYNNDGKYLLGSKNSFEPMSKLNGIKDEGGLSVGNYVRYTLGWQWPFDGNDELDTLIGNLAAEGDVITVSLKISVTASEDPDASGGAPQTGDTGNVGMWVSLCAVSFIMLIVLTVARKKEQEVR